MGWLDYSLPSGISMSETNNNAQHQQPKTSALARWSLGLAIASFTPAAPITAPLAIILGIISIFKINRSEGRLKGRGLAIGETAVGAAMLSVLVFGCIYIIMMVRHVVCGMNLKGLGVAMWTYANDYDNRYPTPDRWCDLLIQHDYTTEKQFKCPCCKGPCSYAMNPNCEPNSPPDTVLLFESQPGWNQFGGPEILTVKHFWPKCCNILLNNGRLVFVETEHIAQLKWKPSKNNN